jgi:hypothetical protein
LVVGGGEVETRQAKSENGVAGLSDVVRKQSVIPNEVCGGSKLSFSIEERFIAKIAMEKPYFASLRMANNFICQPNCFYSGTQ